MKERRRFCVGVMAIALTTLMFPAWALSGAPGPDGYYTTGEAIRTKSIAFIKVKVYAIRHEMKAPPAEKSKQAIIASETDKRFVLRMLRDVSADKLRNALKDAYEENGYKDTAKIQQLMSALSVEAKEGTLITISYDAARKATSMRMSNAGSAEIGGSEFMRATWSIWFGKIDPASLSDDLMSKL